MGVTIVHPLQCTGNRSSAQRIVSATGLPEILESFRAAVDEVVPGMFAWFAPASLHVTIRAVMG